MRLQLHFQCVILDFLKKRSGGLHWDAPAIMFLMYLHAPAGFCYIHNNCATDPALKSTCFRMSVLLLTADNRYRGDLYQSFARNVHTVEPIFERRKQNFGDSIQMCLYSQWREIFKHVKSLHLQKTTSQHHRQQRQSFDPMDFRRNGHGKSDQNR